MKLRIVCGQFPFQSLKFIDDDTGQEVPLDCLSFTVEGKPGCELTANLRVPVHALDVTPGAINLLTETPRQRITTIEE